MYIEMTDCVGTPTQTYEHGQVYELDDAEAERWIKANVAKRTTKLPPVAESMYRRLEAGAGKDVLFLPFFGEFGHLCMTHIRIVHFHQAARKVVCCRPGEECLFPSADEVDTQTPDPVPDRKRVGTLRGVPPLFKWFETMARHPGLYPMPAGSLTVEQELISLHPDKRIYFKPKRRGYEADVIIGMRERQIFRERNWGTANWQRLADAIKAEGLTFGIIGAVETAPPLKGMEFHTEGNCDAAVESLQNCHLYVGTDSGGSHLAAAVGAKMIVFRESKTPSRDLRVIMAKVNRGNVDIVPDKAGVWERPERVIDRVVGALNANAGTARK